MNRRIWTLVLALGVGCGPKKPVDGVSQAQADTPSGAESGAEPAALPPPVSPLVAPSVLPPGAPALPPLSGATADLDLVTLTSTTTSFTIEADTAMFVADDPRVAPRLLAALELDPRWRVGLWEGQTVAWQRRADAAGWRAPWGGYWLDGAVTSRALLRFDARPEGHPWSLSGLVARNLAGVPKLRVKGWRVDDGAWTGQQAAAFTIDGAGISFEMHEIAQNLQLTATQRALGAATLRTKAVVDQVARGDLQRSTLAMVPRGEPELGDASAVVSSRDGVLDIRGRVNPRQPGWTFVRLLDADGAAVREGAVASATAERVGYDENDAVVAFFQSEVPWVGAVPRTGQVEVWFAPDDGGDVRRLGTFGFELPPGEDSSRVPIEGIEQ